MNRNALGSRKLNSMSFAVVSLLFPIVIWMANALVENHLEVFNEDQGNLRRQAACENQSYTSPTMTPPASEDEAESDDQINDEISTGLMDPRLQPKFVEHATNLLLRTNSIEAADFDGDVIQIGAYEIRHRAGLRDPVTRKKLETTVLGYGRRKEKARWPGPTIVAESSRSIYIEWENNLFNVTKHAFSSRDGRPVIDTSIHWAYTVHGYEEYNIEKDGIPLVPHLHGMNSDEKFDGNSEAFYSPGYAVKGPYWRNEVYHYENAQPAATLWYHDHSLGMTRLNVNAGLVGLYIIRDSLDTGLENNALGLPAGEFERAYVIQDRMFNKDGSLFYPAFKGDPYYQDFIVDEGTAWDSDRDGATALAEFFGDFITVNGKIWPKDNVKPRRYRLRLLNGCDSRFIVLEFWACGIHAVDVSDCTQVPYTVIGTDQGLLASPIAGVTRSLLEVAGRLDLVIDFSPYQNRRVIMKNLGGDSPFGGEIPGPQLYEFTDRIMAFDVSVPDDPTLTSAEAHLSWRMSNDVTGPVVKVRKVGLFEGSDEFGRLQPMLGGEMGMNTIETMAYSHPVTENPTLGTTEEWIIFNFSEDAHPVHLHVVFFQVIGRYPIIWDSHINHDGFLGEDLDLLDSSETEDGDRPCNTTWCKDAIPKGDGVYLENFDIMQHNGATGKGVRAIFPGDPVNFYDRNASVVLGEEYYSESGGRKDVVTAMPGQATIIRTTFNRPGRFVWHCHILSHEDHEMMRPFDVVLA